MKKQKIILTEEKKEKLIETHSKIKNKKLADRIKAVLLLNDGYSKNEIEKILLIDRRTILRYVKRYKKGGLKKLLKDKYPEKSSKLSKQDKEELKKDLRENLFPNAKAVCDHVLNKFGKKYRQESMVKLLHKLGFSYKKTKPVPAKANKNEQLKFIKDIENLQKELPANSKLYYMDAAHLLHNSVPSYAWIEKGKEKEIKSNSGRQRESINGLISPIDYEIIIKQSETVNSQSTIELLEKTEAMHPELDTIFIIRDNAKYYSSKLVKEYLINSKIIMIPMPTYSPNLNLIERLWKLAKKYLVNNKYHEKFKDFQEAIRIFFTSDILHLKDEIESLMSEKFHLVDSS